MKSKILLLGLLFAAGTQLSYAISIGSISDAISTQSSPSPTQKSEVKNEKVAEPTTTASTQPSSKNKQMGALVSNPALFIEDAAITGYIHAKLLLNKDIRNVDVTTENAVVSLNGTVDTQDQADKLIKIASSVKGVKFVNTDRLTIREN